MKILASTWVLTCDEDNSIIKNGAVVFTDKIIDIDYKERIQEKYPNVEITQLEENSVLMPGLVNSHVHLEFSANSSTLKYGNFMDWLNSVIKNREELINNANNEVINVQLKKMQKTGTTTIGAISSYGFELDSCVNSKLNVVYFNEVIGSKPDMIDTLFADFKSRLENSKKHKSKRFIPALAIHSPYSVHPILLKHCLNIAKDENLTVSSHFLESPQEHEWLHKDEGGFLDFFKNFLGQEKAVTKPMQFLNAFEGVKNLSFTHCVETNQEELDKIKSLGAYVNHCPTSNRLLNNKKLNLNKLGEIKFTVGTDGLSSNNSLSMFDELRNALMIHTEMNCVDLSKKLLRAATYKGSRALGFETKGSIQKDFDADIICLTLPDIIENKEDLALNIILHTKFVKDMYIGGESV